MSKVASKNINRYKIRGGELNPFEYQQNHTAVSQQEASHDFWSTSHENADRSLSADQAEAERHKQLLIAHGEPLPETVDATPHAQEDITPPYLEKAAQKAAQKKEEDEKPARTKKTTAAPKSVKPKASVKQATSRKATTKARAK